MKNLIVTNNIRFLSVNTAVKKYFKIIPVEGTLKKVVEVSRDYLMTDYQLAADPLAGRRERPTPYLTIIMEAKKSEKDNTARDILSVESFNVMFEENREILEQMSESHKKDFGLIDYTLTMSVCDKMCI